MKFFGKMRWTSMVLFAAVAASFTPVAHAATTPYLGAADTFSVLARTYTNNTIAYGTSLFGDAGYATFAGFASYVGGMTHVSDATYTQAGADQHAALSALNIQPCTVTFVGAVDLATDTSHGTLGIYTPGVYCSSGAMSIGGGGSITFDGAGTYIFRSVGTLSTSASSHVTTTNGASACDVFWTPQLPTPPVATTLGTDTTFVGTVIEPVGAAYSDITVGGGTHWTGRALAFDWRVTTNPIILKYVNITAPTCPVPPHSTTATLHVIKTFYNDYGGTAVSSDAMVHVKNGAGDVVGSPLAGAGSPGTSYTLNADTYTVSEDAFAGYTPTFSGDCDASGHVALAANDNKTCTISNDQNPPPPPSPATLHVIKHVINNDGGTATASSFMLHVKGATGGGPVDVSGSPAAGAETPGTSYSLVAGTYAVSEDAFSGYAASFSGDCDSSGHVILAASDNKTCTITNDDIAQIGIPATLHVIKHVINNDGGTATASSFTLHVKGSGMMGLVDVTGSPAAGAESPGTSYSLAAGTYEVSENTPTGYTQSFSGDCDFKGGIVLASGNDKTCTITNDDIAQTSISFATLHVIKHVVNDNGGTSTASSFNLHVKGYGMFGLSDVSGSPAAGAEAPGTSYSLAAGSYAVSEDAHAGYTQSFTGDCDDGGNISLISGTDKTCIITNNDTPATTVPPATLHVIKIVINDNGGKAVASDAVMHVTSGTTDVAGSPQAGAAAPGTSYSLSPGTYTVSENFFAGYTVLVGGDCTANGTVSLASGDNKTCTITNNDIAGIITTITPPVVPPPTPSACEICGKLAYDVYIINPNLTERHSGTAWVRVTDRGNKVLRYSFEDKTLDPKDSNYDYNDAVVDVDYTDCKHVRFLFVSSDADWKHKIRFRVTIDGVRQSDTLVTNDSKSVVGTSKTVDATLGVNTAKLCPPVSTSLNGRILLQVQQHGEAWYVRPETGLRYYMKDGPTAYGMMRNFGLGITDKDLATIPSVDSVDALKISVSACGSNAPATAQKGKILLQVQQHGEAWYVDVAKCRRLYLKDGAAAYSIMRFLGLGITDTDLAKLTIGT